jgi:hypothetical protein
MLVQIGVPPCLLKDASVQTGAQASLPDQIFEQTGVVWIIEV